MTMLASQITSLTVVYSIVYSGVNQRKHQSSASLAFVRQIHRGPVNFPHKWPVTRKMFPFDDVIMKVWKSHVENPSKESKHDIKEPEGNMLSPIFNGNVQGQEHPGRCAFAEPELFCFRKPKRVVQNKNNGHKNLNNNQNYHDEIILYQGISKRNSWHSTLEQRTPENSSSTL